MIGIFWFFGAIMASLAASTLLWRGTALDGIWVLNPTAYKQLTPLGGRLGFSSCYSAEPCRDGNRVVPTPALGMEISDRNHRYTGSRGSR